MEAITKLMYWISTGLLVPVIVLLIVFFIKALLTIGRFYSEYTIKKKQNKVLNSVFDSINSDTIDQELANLKLDKISLLKLYLDKIVKHKDSEIHCNKIINNFETACQKDLGKSQTLSKMGPILGLMGTLIPMGPALTGLATGDIASMANNMQVAFATTVIGLLIGAIGFVTQQIKKRWYTSDINNLEFVSELYCNKK